MTLGPVSTHAYPRCLLQRLHRRVRRNPVQYVQFGQGALFIPHSFFVLTPYPSHRARPSRHLHRFDRIKSLLSAHGRTSFNSTASYLRIVSADYNPPIPHGLFLPNTLSSSPRILKSIHPIPSYPIPGIMFGKQGHCSLCLKYKNRAHRENPHSTPLKHGRWLPDPFSGHSLGPWGIITPATQYLVHSW